MPQSEFLKTAMKVIKDHPEVFEALEEYDRTRKLRKTTYRERLNITIDANLLRKFKRHSQERNLNMSRVIEKHIKEELGLKN